MSAVNNSSIAWGFLPQQETWLADVKQYYLPLVIITGVICNLLVLKTLHADRACASVHNAVYIYGLALVDLCYLSVVTVIWLRTFDLDLYNRAGWCQTWTLLGFLCEFLTIWLTTGFVLEGLALHKLRTRIVSGGWFPAWRPRFYAASVTVIAVVVYMNITLLFGVTSSPPGGKCLPLPAHVHQIRLLNEVDVFVNVLLPYTIITVTMAASLVQATAQALRSRGSGERRFSTHVQVDHEPGRGLVTTLALVFVALSAPSRLIRFWQTTVDLFHGHQMLHRGGKIVIIQHALIQLSFARSICNFLLYTCMWPAFRKHLCSCCCSLGMRGPPREEDIGDVIMELETEMDYVSTAIENSDNELIELVEAGKIQVDSDSSQS